MTYRDRLCAHLGTYKREVLRVAEDGIWKRNGKPYPHILPEALRHLNVLETIRPEFWRAFQTWEAKLHRDFHHLNSSQAMCFNLFFPFLGSAPDLPILLAALSLPEEAEVRGRFEYTPDPVEGTNFDFFLRTPSAEAFFEIKLSESEFGTAKRDEAHLRKLETLYAPRLRQLVVAEALEPGFFFSHYQLLRNVAALALPSKPLVYLLVPREVASPTEHGGTSRSSSRSTCQLTPDDLARHADSGCTPIARRRPRLDHPRPRAIVHAARRAKVELAIP